MLCNLFNNRLLRGVKNLTPQNKGCQWTITYLFSKIHRDNSDLENKKVTVERTITKEEVDLFSQLTGDFNSVHSSSQNECGVVHGAFLNGIVSGVIGTRLPGHGTLVVSQTLRFPNPCHVGETVEVTVEIKDVRKILTCNYQVVNKLNRAIVLEGNAKLIFKSSKE